MVDQDQPKADHEGCLGEERRRCGRDSRGFHHHGRLCIAAYAFLAAETDRGSEFSFTFLLAVERRGIRHRYIPARRPDQNGKLERSHRVDAEEFWGQHTLDSFEAAAAALDDWERVYNEVRFSMALKARTPAENLAAILAAA